jgi:hypothetical protein
VWRCFLPDYFCALWIAIPARRNSRYEPIACFPSSCSQGTKIIALGPFPPSGNGDPAMGAKAPVLLLIVNTETSLDALHTYTKCPKLSDVIPSGPLIVPLPPLGNGEPAIGIRPPVVESRVKAEMVASAPLGT